MVMKRVSAVVIFITLAFTALAQPPTPSEIFGDIGDFFISIIQGSPDFASAYFLTLILYFIIFISLYVEGIKKIPLFGGKDEINTPGKWFAGAVAFLSTMGVFMTEQASQKTGKELISFLIAPFGIYAGVALAGVFAYITYKMLRDTNAFEEHVIVPMAVAAAIGLTIAGWLLANDTIFGYGYLIALIVMIVGLIMKWAEIRGDSDSGSSGGSWSGGSRGGGSGSSRSGSGGSSGGGSGSSRGGSDSEEKEEEEKEETEKEEELAVKLRKVLRRIYRFVGKTHRQLKAAHKESKKDDPEVEKIKKELRKAQRYEQKAIKFDALATEEVKQIKSFSEGNPTLKKKLDILNKLIETQFEKISANIKKAEESMDNLDLVTDELSKAVKSAGLVEKYILGMEIEEGDLKKEMKEERKQLEEDMREGKKV